MPRPSVTALIVAAGRGLRAGGGLPKQFRDVAGEPVIRRSAKAFKGLVDEVVLVIHPDDADIVATLCPDFRTVEGGATRAESVANGLTVINSDLVLVHDAARPLVSRSVIEAVIDALAEGANAAAPAVPVTDALWTGDTFVTGIQDRTGLWRAQTPQGFRRDLLQAAHAAYDGEAADDVEVMRAAGHDVTITAGHEDNIKITGPDDFDRAARLLKDQGMDIRVGNGFDVHRFGPGDHVTLCGIAVPHNRGLQGHSDADVGLHTITDAIYGALAEGDIGTHFPPTDDQWKGMDSTVFLKHAVALAADRGFRVSNVDCTLICERPKIGPHAQQMRDQVAEVMNLEVGRVSVKATTTERLGFAGREEGIACMATVTLVAS